MSDRYITIYQKGDVHIVDMFQKNVLTTKREISVDRGFIDDICGEIQRITLMANRMLYEHIREESSSEIVDNLKSIGELLFKNLFPEDIQKALRESEEADLYLRLDEEVLHIPWELCFDGKDFMSLKFRVGRQVLTEKKTLAPIKDFSKERVSMLIIIDPSETLRYAQKEAELLYSLLEAETDIRVELIGGRHASKLHILKEMKGKDIVHFIGHSFYDKKQRQRSGWVLKDGVITSEEISRMDDPPVVVFSNSCQAVAVSTEGMYLFDDRSLSIGGGFIIAGVKNFIGPLWVVHDERSVKFAVDFYRAFVSGKSLGQALNEAKRSVIKRDGPNNLLWASYVLYGDPSIKITEKGQEIKNNEKIIFTQTVSSHNKGRTKMKFKTLSFILLFCILLFGYLLWKSNWFSIASKVGSPSITTSKDITASRQNNYATLGHESGKDQGSSVSEQGYILPEEKSKMQAFNVGQKETLPFFQNSFLRVTVQSISKSRDKRRVNLALAFENPTKEDIWIAIRKMPDQGVLVNMVDDLGGQWKLLMIRGIEVIKGPGWGYEKRKSNYSVFTAGVKSIVTMVFETKEPSDARVFNLGANLWRFVENSPTRFSIGIANIRLK